MILYIIENQQELTNVTKNPFLDVESKFYYIRSLNF